jgi:transcriptional regulator with XRE-family HTH domain
MTINFERIWQKLTKSKRYRAQFVSAQAKRSFPYQLRAIMKKRGMSQETLAKQADISQGVISRAANPNYGNLTINTIVKIVGGLDMAYIGLIVPFSELAKWVANLSEEGVQVSTFDEENILAPVKTRGDVPLEKRQPFPHGQRGSALDAMRETIQ